MSAIHAVQSPVERESEREPLPEWWVAYLLKSEPRLFILSAFTKVLWSACALTCAFYFVRTLVATTDINFGVGICIAYLVVSMMLSISAQFLGLFSGQLGSRAKARLAALVAEHALLHAVTSQTSQALALTLSSSDAHLVYDGAMTFHNLWAAPVEAIVIIGLLIFLSGDSGWIAAGIVTFVVITMYILSVIMTRIRGRFNAIQSKQVTLFFEVLQNMRPFRFYGWDEFFLGKLNKLTDEMAPLLVQLGYFKSLNLALVFACPPLMAIAIFGHYTKSIDLPAGLAFTTLSLFNTLRFPLVVLPNAVRAYSSASTAYNRIREFLGSEKAVDTRVLSPTSGAVEIENLPVGPNKTILANWKAQPGELWVFQGPVRSYKSTLIETIAGHYPIPSSASVRVGGRVSYAMQQPWMQQATIKDNIVCCEPWNEERYKQVIFACALTTDLSIMPLGDATPVAEKGISLSGGQRQRVALARAVYRIADVYLLDNPISALDDQTQEHVWTHLFEGLLQCATVIVGSSRPVISCTAVLQLSTHGVSEGESGVIAFNGPVVASASAKVPPRYSKTSQSYSSSASAEFESSQKISDVAAKVVPDVAVQIAPPSPKMEPAMPATFRSRLSSLNMTIEEAAVGDVSEEVAAYARYADLIEEEKASAEGGIGSAIKNVLFGNPESHGSVAVEMAAVASDSPGGGRCKAPSFRARTSSFKDFCLDQQFFQDPISTGTIDLQSTAISDSISTNGADFASEKRGSMRERVGSRRSNFLEYAESSNIFTSVADLSSPAQVIVNQTDMSSFDQNDSSGLGPISEHAETPEPRSSTGSQNKTAKHAHETTQQKHGLRRWADAGGFRLYLFICLSYPIAQIIRILSDMYVRYWTEKTFFSSQQANLEVYSWLVGGYVACSSQHHFILAFQQLHKLYLHFLCD
jgi:ABC-type multidrug transport system fused ATPase/permease subunit